MAVLGEGSEWEAVVVAQPVASSAATTTGVLDMWARVHRGRAGHHGRAGRKRLETGVRGLQALP
jgi:hypothetical protein